MNSYILSRQGYGSQFNDLIINNGLITKKSKNEYGIFKITKEINFYKFIKNNNISLSVPNILEFGYDYYVMEYLSDYIPLYKIFNTFSSNEKCNIIQRIHNELNILHKSENRIVNKDYYKDILFTETHTKITTRYKEISNIIDRYNFIKKVNNIELMSLEDILSIINKKINEYVSKLDEYKAALIHGDCQFNNILYNKTNNELPKMQ